MGVTLDMDPMKTVTIKPRTGEGKTFEIVDAQARNSISQAEEDISQLQEDMETALKPRKLYARSDTRLTSANFAPEGDNTLTYFNATSAIPAEEGRPPGGDAHILKMNWDNTGQTGTYGWDAMLAITNARAQINKAATALFLRVMTGSTGAWSDWYSLLDLIYPVGSVYISSTNTDPNTVFGGGTWTLSHKRFAYQTIENPVTYNTTNTASGVSTAVLNGETIQLRMTYTLAVDTADTSVDIGQLDLSAIGLTGKYSEIVLYISDGAGAIGMVQISSTGAITNIDVVGKSGGTIPASGAYSGQVRASLMFGQGSVVDSFCDEFHWVRTA